MQPTTTMSRRAAALLLPRVAMRASESSPSKPVHVVSIARHLHASYTRGWSPASRGATGVASTTNKKAGFSTVDQQMDGVAATAQEYYADPNSVNCYRQVWGDGIHVGRYDLLTAEESKMELMPRISRASTLSTGVLLTKANLNKNFISNESTIMDMGAGYGDTARMVAKDYGCNVVCIEVAGGMNAVNAERSAAAGMSEKIIIPGDRSFFDTQIPASSMDLVLVQDCFCHCGLEVHKAIKEAERVLKPGSVMAFTDVMKSDTADPGALAKVFEGTPLFDPCSPSLYEKWAKDYGLEFLEFDNRSDNMGFHYSNLIARVSAVRGTIEGVEDSFLDEMTERWSAILEAYEKDLMHWGMIVLKKPE